MANKSIIKRIATILSCAAVLASGMTVSMAANASSKDSNWWSSSNPDSANSCIGGATFLRVKAIPHISRYLKRDKEKLPARMPRA